MYFDLSLCVHYTNDLEVVIFNCWEFSADLFKMLKINPLRGTPVWILHRKKRVGWS